METTENYKRTYCLILILISNFCSTGRVHTAVVSSINWETRSITVEWFERNETKGKEVGNTPNVANKI